MNPNWSDMPDELLTLIADCFDSRLELVRFRSVCRSWRSSSTHKRFPDMSLQIQNPISSVRLISYFHIKPSSSSSSSNGWLIKLENLKSDKIRCLSPLSRLPIRHSSQILDFFELQVSRVYETRAIIPLQVSRVCETRDLSAFKRVVLFPESMETPRILSIGMYKKIHYWDHEGETWIRLDDDQVNFHDMIVTHKNQLFVVDEDGTIYWVNHSLHLIQYAPPVGNQTWQKHLVESRVELY